MVILLRPRVIVYTNPGENNFVKPQASVVPVSQVEPVAVPTSAPAPIQITPAPYESFKPALPVKVQSTPPVKQVPVVESKGGYIPRNNGYTPGYLSKSYESPTVTSSRPVYPSASSAAGASVQPFFENSIISPPASKPSQPIDRSPLSQEIYNQATPINIYDAYERSVGGAQ